MSNYTVEPIGTVYNNEKGAWIEIEKKYIPAMKAMEGFSHVQVIWWFSDFDEKQYRTLLEVDQPYKKAPAKMGIFATRSPVRPNPIALSTSQIVHVDVQKGMIHLAYIDANDQTPVLDIKPYTPSLDRIENPSVPDWCSHWPKSSEESGEFDWENEFIY